MSTAKTVVGRPVSAKVAYFSARGPNSIEPAILKVDDNLFFLFMFALNAYSKWIEFVETITINSLDSIGLSFHVKTSTLVLV